MAPESPLKVPCKSRTLGPLGNLPGTSLRSRELAGKIFEQSSIFGIHNVMKNYGQLALLALDHPYRILIIGGSGSGKTNVLLNLIKNQRPNVDKIY